MGCGCENNKEGGEQPAAGVGIFKTVTGAIAHVAHGAVGLAKAAAGVDRPTEAIVDKRRAICRACPQAIPCPLAVGKKCKCELCGCFLKAKTAILAESCPAGHWPAATTPPTEPPDQA